MIKPLKPIAAAAATVLALNAHAAVDMFLELEGSEIQGESQDSNYKGAIDVLAWSWNIANSGSFFGGDIGKAAFGDVSFTKWVDSSSMGLLQLATNGDHFETARLTLRKPSEAGPFEFQQLVMSKVLVTSVSTGGSGGEDRLTENVTLNFESFCIGYVEQTDTGGEGLKNDFCWNIGANANCTAAHFETLYSLPIAQSLPLGQLMMMDPSCPG